MSHSSKNRRAEKQEQFARAREGRRSIRPNVILTILGTLLVLSLVYIVVSGPSTSTAATTVTPVAKSGSDSGSIQIPLAQITEQAKFYEYQTASQKKLRFFVIKSSDGVYRAAADACVVCYREKKGYRQQGDDMVCNNCRKHFPSAYVNEVTGGCNPDGIPRTIQGDKLLIAASDLEARAELF
jgi:uncharacterized membrane protein